MKITGIWYYWVEGMNAERATIMAEEARRDAMQHLIREMRALYERCAVHLDFEAKRLARTFHVGAFGA